MEVGEEEIVIVLGIEERAVLKHNATMLTTSEQIESLMAFVILCDVETRFEIGNMLVEMLPKKQLVERFCEIAKNSGQPAG